MALQYISFHRGMLCLMLLCIIITLYVALYRNVQFRDFILKAPNGFENPKERAPNKVSIPLATSHAPQYFVLRDTGSNSTAEDFIGFLAKDLKYKLEKVIPNESIEVSESCTNKTLRDKSCSRSGCLRLKFPNSTRSRVAQLVGPPRLHYNSDYQKVFDDMADSVPGYYDLILVTGASSNHYLESKTLLYNLHTIVFPHIHNFTLVYYDLGLTDVEREDISRKCECHVRRFPFSRFPKVFSYLKCYAWKPMIINAHAPRCNLVHWMDASIRFSDIKNAALLEKLYRRARAYGVQSGSHRGLLPRVTLRSMPHFFGDELCVYHPFTDFMSGFMIFHNEPLVREAVLRPWSACALHEDCMCPYKRVKLRKVVYCPRRWDPSIYSLCHRFEQSAVNIILRKLFQGKSTHILRDDILDYIDVKREDKSLADKL